MMKKGFTLIELVMTTMLSAMVITMLYTSFSQSNRTLKYVDEVTDVDTQGAIVLHQLERDLGGAVMLFPEEKKKEAVASPEKKEEKPKNDKFFYATSKNNQLDMLTFITLNPLSSYDNPKPRLLRVVYRLKEQPTQPERYQLLRQEGADLDVSLFEKSGEKKPRALVVTNNIKECSLEFLYTTTTDPKEVTVKKALIWDTDKDRSVQDAEPKPPLPMAVRIKLIVEDDLARRERRYEYLMPVYSAQYAYEYEIAKSKAPAKQLPQQKASPQNSFAAQPGSPAMKIGARVMKPSFINRIMGLG